MHSYISVFPLEIKTLSLARSPFAQISSWSRLSVEFNFKLTHISQMEFPVPIILDEPIADIRDVGW